MLDKKMAKVYSMTLQVAIVLCSQGELKPFEFIPNCARGQLHTNCCTNASASPAMLSIPYKASIRALSAPAALQWPGSCSPRSAAQGPGPALGTTRDCPAWALGPLGSCSILPHGTAHTSLLPHCCRTELISSARAKAGKCHPPICWISVPKGSLKSQQQDSILHSYSNFLSLQSTIGLPAHSNSIPSSSHPHFQTLRTARWKSLQ